MRFEAYERSEPLKYIGDRLGLERVGDEEQGDDKRKETKVGSRQQGVRRRPPTFSLRTALFLSRSLRLAPYTAVVAHRLLPYALCALPFAICREIRCPERQKDEEVDQHRIDEMDREIDHVIAEDIEPVELIVQRKGQVAYIAVAKRQTFVPLGERGFYEIGQVFYEWSVGDIYRLVPLEGAVEGVGIDEKAEDDDYEEMGKTALEKKGLPACFPAPYVVRSSVP